jgi:hypothetical protein
MNKTIEVREYVFPLFVGTYPKEGESQHVTFDNRNYLGTAFFVSKNGVALTAGHCVPDRESLGPNSLLAGLWDGTHVRSHRILAATKIDNYDVAILKIENIRPKYLPLAYANLPAGTDVMTFGIPEHSVWNMGKEFRCLKGHITFVTHFFELSFAAPKGMSGSPVLVNGEVVGVLSGNARSETLEDQCEEKTEVFSGMTKKTIVETKQVINYGLAAPLLPLKDWKHEICGERPFSEFIHFLNARSDKQ